MTARTAEHLDPQRVALLVVDIQERLMAVIHERERVEKNSALLLRAAATLELPVLATTQYRERIGPLVPPVAELLPRGLEPLDKMHFDCFRDPAFPAALSRLPSQVDTLVICGVESHICVYQTVVGALDNGYRVWLPADAISSRTPANRKIGLGRCRDLGAVVGSTEMIIYDLLGRAGTDAFRALLPHLK